MESDVDSPLGVTEAFMVRLLRGPQLVGKVFNRVKELLSSEELAGDDQDILQKSLPARYDDDEDSDPKTGT
jgi:hypothetical protein